MQNQRLTLLRLAKEEKQLLIDPVPGVIVKREGTFNFHFCIYEAEAPYTGGFYHGMLQLPENYPFSAPKLMFFTPSGRFQVNIPICTTFTHYHQQSWTSAWNVRTLVLATVSFMCSEEAGYGCKHASDNERKILAQQSLKKNLENPLFKQLFGAELMSKHLISKELLEMDKILVQPKVLLSKPQQALDAQQQNNLNRDNNYRKFWKAAIAVVAIGGIAGAGIIYVMRPR